MNTTVNNVAMVSTHIKNLFLSGNPLINKRTMANDNIIANPPSGLIREWNAIPATTNAGSIRIPRDKKSVNDFEEEKLNEDDGDSNNSNLKENADESASFGRFKKSMTPSSWGSFMCLMEEVVKVGQTICPISLNLKERQL
ncbi:hypothetical protein Tco_1199301 [Tanacetum coccineum]